MYIFITIFNALMAFIQKSKRQEMWIEKVEWPTVQDSWVVTQTFT